MGMLCAIRISKCDDGNTDVVAPLDELLQFRCPRAIPRDERLPGGVEPRPPPVAVRQHRHVTGHGGAIQPLDHLGLVGGVEPGWRPDTVDDPAYRRHAPRVDPAAGLIRAT